jgi:uncharacterized protein YggE
MATAAMPAQSVMTFAPALPEGAFFLETIPMRRLAFAFALFLPFTLPAFADAPVPQLTANGEGTVIVVPDIAIVTLGVATDGKTAAEALAGNSSAMEASIAAIRAAGVAEKDIATSGFNVSPVYSNPPVRDDGSQGDPKIVGYRVSNEVRVTVRDIGAAGGLLDHVVTAGANMVSGISFDNADNKGLGDRAILAAIADAKRKAALMADAAGVKLVRILSVSTNEGPPPPMPYRMEMAAKAVPVMAGERAVTANATIVWEVAEK